MTPLPEDPYNRIESLIDFKQYPTLYTDTEKGRCHESILRSFHIASHLMKMVNRGDSKETIAEVFLLLKNLPEPTKP